MPAALVVASTGAAFPSIALNWVSVKMAVGGRLTLGMGGAAVGVGTLAT